MKPPKNNDRFYWTNHVFNKMRFYGLSETKIKGVLSRPDRKEEGVAVKTMAVMQKVKSKKPTEIWVMYQKVKARSKLMTSQAEFDNIFTSLQTKIISAWRYPGISPIGGKIPIPDGLLEELESENDL
ncbi:hypothetical protein HY061_03385 [Candidatus Azambacteria bacterium]|nr:hypothetical protein [Candidatus Azambacteria bacterium]